MERNITFPPYSSNKNKEKNQGLRQMLLFTDFFVVVVLTVVSFGVGTEWRCWKRASFKIYKLLIKMKSPEVGHCKRKNSFVFLSLWAL